MINLRPQLTPRAEQRLGLVLTPQMRQRIEMLSMTLADLAELAVQEVAENPLLEEVDPHEPVEGISLADELAAADRLLDKEEIETFQSSTEAPVEAEAESASLIADSNSASIDEASDELPETTDAFAEVDFGSFFEHYLDPGYRTLGEYEEQEEPTLENRLCRQPTLQEYLQAQIALLRVTEDVRAAAEAIAASLDERGFLADSCAEIAAIGGWTLDVVETARRAVQQLDPVGCASRNVQECFVVQLEQQGHGNRLAVRLVRDYLDYLVPSRWSELAKMLGVSYDIIAQEVALIRQLDPFPGRHFARVSDGLLQGPHLVQPELFIEKVGNEYVIRFNDDGLPQLRISPKYRRLLENPETSREEREFVRNRLRAAIDLLRNIDYRRRTIYRICEAIVECQRDFLDYGPAYIKPMMLKDIAERVGIHLSTVSRVVNGKYVQTPLGIIELRRFFTEGLAKDNGEVVSTDVIKMKIKKLIAEEDPREPLTDDQIARLLAQEGQRLSRRTVAKYREQMHIPGSRERRLVTAGANAPQQ